MDVSEVLRELYALAPDEFVAARNAKVRELRAARERDAADLVAKRRRPSVDQWALNMASRAHPEVVAAWVDAAEELREAHEATAAGRNADLRGAITELRARTAELTALAREWSPKGELSLVLNEIAASADDSDALQDGLLGADVAPGDRDAPRSRRPPVAPGTGTRRAPDERRRLDLDRARAAMEEATTALADARRAAAAAADAHRAAEADRSAADDEVHAARDRLAEAERRRAVAEEQVGNTTRACAVANDELARTERAVATATARLDDLGE